MKRPLIFKILCRFIFAVICLVTLIAFLIAEENLRGKLAWEHCKRDLEAQGEHMDMAYFIPPPVPDDQNFAMTLLFKSYFYDPVTGKADDHQRQQALDKISIYDGGKGDAKLHLKQSITDWQTGNPRDLKAWQTYYRAKFPDMALSQSPEEDVLTAISRLDEIFTELRNEAKARPLSRFDIRYEKAQGANLNHYPVLEKLIRILCLRATAELRLNHTREAYEDIRFGFYLSDSTMGDPFVIGGLFRIRYMSILVGPVWEGIASHRWTDDQLAGFQAQLEGIEYLSEYSRSIRMERAVGYQLMKELCKNPGMIQADDDSLSKSEHAILQMTKVLPGWIYQNLVIMSRWFQESLSCVDVKTQRVDLSRALRDEQKLKKVKSTPYTFLTRLYSPPIIGTLSKFVVAQAWVNEAAIACAIERYRLAHGALPATLDDLQMVNLPHDVINGEPLHYRVTGNDNYLLYSVGWNGIDDGGKAGKKENGSADYTQGDWVWSLKPF